MFSGWYPLTPWQQLGREKRNKIRELRKTIELGHLLPCKGSANEHHEECDCGLLDAEIELEEVWEQK